jgi:hypothetical protein
MHLGRYSLTAVVPKAFAYIIFYFICEHFNCPSGRHCSKRTVKLNLIDIVLALKSFPGTDTMEH